MSGLLSALFTRLARAHAGRAPSHSTPAACRPPNSVDGRSLASLFLPKPAIHKNPHLGVARAACICICPPDAELARTIVLSATAPVHGPIKHGGVGSGCGGGAWRQLSRTFDVRPWGSRSRSSSRSLCPSRTRTLPRRRRTNPASEANSEPRTRQLGVARTLRRLPTRLGVSNPAPTHSGESARAFLADPVLV